MTYLYLVRQKDRSKFKVGVTTNPRARSKQYQTHSLDVEYIGHIEVPNKKYENYIHLELMKQWYTKCNTVGKTEWFNGDFSYSDFFDIVSKIKERVK